MRTIIHRIILSSSFALMTLYSPNASAGQLDYWGNPVTGAGTTAAVTQTAQDCANGFTGGSSTTLARRTANDFSAAFTQFASCLNQVMLNDFTRMQQDYQKLIKAGYKTGIGY